MAGNRIIRVSAGAIALAMLATSCAGERAGSADVPGGEDSSASGGQEKFGTLPSPCGEGDASGATDQGVTDTDITIGFGDDRGFPESPGLSKEMGDAVKAMIDWCNEQGGINGRQIKGNQYDAAYTQATTVMQEACEQDFMLVGHGFAMDDSAEQFRVACNLPAVAGFTVGPNAAMGPMKFEPVPYPVDHYNGAPLRQAADLFPEFAENMDVLLSTSPAVTQGTDKAKAALEAMDIEPEECGVRLSQDGDSSYMPFAEKLKDCGVEALWTAESPDAGQFNLLESMDRVGIDPTLVYEATWYSSVVSEWNTGGAGDGLHVGIVFQPFENADQVPAVQQYLDLVNAQGGKTALLGMQATSAFLLWAQAAQACGSDLTRQCVINELSQVHEWTGGGLHAPSDPGGNMPSSCSLMLELTGTEYEQVAPETVGEYHCSEEALLETDPSTWGTELNEDRIATAFLTPDVIEPTI